nr:hypothetical protein [Tanacetum cinerariifolium]
MSSDSLLARVNTPQSDEDRLKHIELMKIYTTLQKKVLDLEDELKWTKTAQQTKIDCLERRVKKLEKKQRSRTYKIKRLYKVSLTIRVITSFDDEALDKEDTSKQGRIDKIEADEDIALVSTHDDVSIQDIIVQDEGIEDVGEEEVVEVVTTAKMIIDAVGDAAQVTTAIADIPVSAAETIVTTDPTITAESIKTNVEEQEENDALINTRDDIHAKIDVDSQLAQRLHKKEQPKLTNAEKAKLFMEFIKKRRKFFSAKKVEEKKNKPPIKPQQRNIMCNYLKNMEGWKPKSLKNKSFAKIQKLFDKAMKRVNTFVDYRTELVVEASKKDEITEGSLKRTGEELEQENDKKQKMDDDKNLQSLNIVWKLYQMMEIMEEELFLNFRADGNSQMYLTFSKLLNNFDREDLEVLWRFVKDRFIKTKPMDYMDSFLLHTLKTMFEHHVKDNVWKNQQGLAKVLQVDHECEMAYKLLRLVKKHLKEGYIAN